jgi:hypothetical protein
MPVNLLKSQTMKIAYLVIGLVALSAHSFAGSIIASGDSNIAESVTGGNATFFDNVLGAGKSVLIQELDPGTAGFGANLASFYNGLGGGVTATQTTSTSLASLSGVNLFITMLPQSSYSASELSAMTSLLNTGGTIFFIGESTGYGPGNVTDPIITSTLAALGSTMTMAGNDGTVYPVAAGVVANPLTAGVASFTYGFTSLVSGGTPLFLAQDGNPFIEVQSTSASTPEPVSGFLMLSGLTGLGLLAQRKKDPLSR